MMKWTFRKALNQALRDEMAADPEVFVFGLDVDDHKSIFGSTENLLKEFGAQRVFGTPLSEEAMTGVAIGAALNGKKAVHVHIRADFALLAMNQIVNMASNIHYMTAGKLSVPLTIRVVIGRGWGQGMQHCKSLHSVLAHFPGLKVIIPSTAQEAYSLLRNSIQDPNPVIFIEHRWLYDVEGEVDTSKQISSLPALVAQGNDLTIVSTSWMTVEALKAQEVLVEAGLSSDIFNVTQIHDLNFSKIYASIEKTKHCIVIDHDWIEFGFAAEASALIHENAFKNLRLPVSRLGFARYPCPTARALENKFYPKAQDIIVNACEMHGKSVPDLSKFDFYSYENKFRGPF